jgi:bifunctional non-homologous end joining protein LigD
MIKFVEHLVEPGDAVLKSACRMELEGIVSKQTSAPYRSGRTESWVKAKCRAGHEVVIGGWRGSKANLRSLLVGVHRGDHLVHTGRVGTGFNASNSRNLLAKLNKLATTTSPFGGKDAPRKTADVTWVRPLLVAEIELAGWTASGQVRQAAFKGLRSDKPATEVRAERPVTGSKVKPMTKMHRVLRKPRANSVLGVTISHPDKPLWPKGYTKIDLANYLADVGPWTIDHLKGRPCSIIRAPDGVEGEKFFQRHSMKGMSHLVTLVSVSGDRKPYLQVDRPEALIACAQFSTVEFPSVEQPCRRPQQAGSICLRP